jgi:hypothetical protein
MFGRVLDAWGPPPKTYGLSTWPNFVAPQFFLAVGEEGQPCKRLYITKKKSLGRSLAKIIEQRAIKNKVQYIHCR